MGRKRYDGPGLGSRELKDAAKARIAPAGQGGHRGLHIPDGRHVRSVARRTDDTSPYQDDRGGAVVTERAPAGGPFENNGRSRDRIQQALGHVEHGKRQYAADEVLQEKLDTLRRRYGLGDDVIAAVLERAIPYEGGEEAIENGLIDLAQELGLHDVAREIGEHHGIDADDQEAAALNQVNDEIEELQDRYGLDDEEVSVILDRATEFEGDDDAIGRALVELADEHGLEDIADDAADRYGIDGSERAGGAWDDDSDDDVDIDDDVDTDDHETSELEREAVELITRIGGNEEDVNTLLAYVAYSGDTPIEALQALADHQGLDLDQLEAQVNANTDTGDAADSSQQPPGPFDRAAANPRKHAITEHLNADTDTDSSSGDPAAPAAAQAA